MNSEAKNNETREELYASLDATFDNFFGHIDYDDDVSLENAMHSNHNTEQPSEIIIDGDDHVQFQIVSDDAPVTTNKVVTEPKKAEAKKETIQKGDKVRILSHTVYQHLSHGATIEPRIEHHLEFGQSVTVTAVFIDQFEDEHGNPYDEISVETAHGIFAIEDVEKI